MRCRLSWSCRVLRFVHELKIAESDSKKQRIQPSCAPPLIFQNTHIVGITARTLLSTRSSYAVPPPQTPCVLSVSIPAQNVVVNDGLTVCGIEQAPDRSFKHGQRHAMHIHRLESIIDEEVQHFCTEALAPVGGKSAMQSTALRFLARPALRCWPGRRMHRLLPPLQRMKAGTHG